MLSNFVKKKNIYQRRKNNRKTTLAKLASLKVLTDSIKLKLKDHCSHSYHHARFVSWKEIYDMNKRKGEIYIGEEVGVELPAVLLKSVPYAFEDSVVFK